jgi:phage-related protein
MTIDILDNTPFTWIPDKNYRRKPNPRTLSISMEDGFSFRAADGINSFDDTWTLTFNNRNIGEIRSIEDYLAERVGAIAFSWCPPDTSFTYRVACSTWNSTLISLDYGSLSTTFKRIYE